MQALQDLEKLEIEILELFNSIRVLDYLYSAVEPCCASVTT